MPRPHTWGRAQVWWADGSERQAWLKPGDTTAFTAAVASQVALRIRRGEARSGAGTPIELVGLSLVGAAGGEIVTREV